MKRQPPLFMESSLTDALGVFFAAFLRGMNRAMTPVRRSHNAVQISVSQIKDPAEKGVRAGVEARQRAGGRVGGDNRAGIRRRRLGMGGGFGADVPET